MSTLPTTAAPLSLFFCIISDTHTFVCFLHFLTVSLPNLDTVGNDFLVVGFSWKTAQTSLANFFVPSVGGDFNVGVDVFENDALAELAQQMISTEGVLENVTISITGGVTDLTPLSGLKHIKVGDLAIWGNTNLASLAPLENLEVVDGDLWIFENEALTDISLPSLTEVGGQIDVAFNDVLASGEYQPSHTAPLFFAFFLTHLHFIYCAFVLQSPCPSSIQLAYPFVFKCLQQRKHSTFLQAFLLPRLGMT